MRIQGCLVFEFKKHQNTCQSRFSRGKTTVKKIEALIKSESKALEALNKNLSKPVVISSHDGGENELFGKERITKRLRNRAVVSQSCTAALFREVSEWDESSLEIKWKASQREFTVAFKGVGEISLSVEDLLSKKVPLYIAQSSTCECGENLELGDYSIRTTDDDFEFEGSFSCPKCKLRVFREGTGIRNIIGQWIQGLKKIEINAIGVGIERE